MRFIILLSLIINLHATERIITLSPAIAEIVAALGAQDDIVGVSEYTLFPPSLQNRPKVGGYFSLSLEKILVQNPTLVIGLPQHTKILNKLEHFHIKTLTLPLQTITEIKNAITITGDYLNRKTEVLPLIEAINKSIKNAPKLTKSKKVLIVFANASGIKKGVYVAGHNLYFEEILHICGAQNAFSDDYAAQPLLHIENLIATNPDTVILLFGPKDNYEASKVMASWQILPINAVKTQSIKIIQSDYLLIPSHRVAKSIQTLCEAIK